MRGSAISNSPQGRRVLAQLPGAASTAAVFAPVAVPQFGNPNNGRGGNPAGVDQLGGTWTPWNPAHLLRSEFDVGLLHADFPPNPGPPTTVLGEFHLGQYINPAARLHRRRCSIV